MASCKVGNRLSYLSYVSCIHGSNLALGLLNSLLEPASPLGFFLIGPMSSTTAGLGIEIATDVFRHWDVR
eukprot:8101490-Prorocentrum_lima.AAC.1